MALLVIIPGGCRSLTPRPQTTVTDQGVAMGVQAGRGGAGSPTLDRSVPPRPGPPPRVTLPEFHRFTLTSGLEVVVVERPGVPLVHLELMVRGGVWSQEGRPGLAGFAMDLLDEGTSRRSALEIAEAVEGMGGELVTEARWDHSVVSLNLLSPRLEEGLALMAEVTLAPAFSPDEVERVRRERMNRILQSMDDPAQRANDLLLETLYGPDHPYGRPLLGTRESLEAITREEMEAWHRRSFRGGNAVLLVAGDVKREGVEGLLEAAWAAWPSGEPPPEPLPPPLPTRPGVTVVVDDRPGAPQSEIRVGRVSVPRGTPDEAALVVLNTVLGGSFTSRLMQNLREEKGFTYGAASTFQMRRHPGPFVAWSAVHTPVTAEAVGEFLAEMRRLAREPVPADELERARNYVALRLPQRFESLADVAARVGEVILYGLPDGWWQDWVPAVQGVSADDVLAAAGRELGDDGTVVVVVGDRAEVEEALRQSGFGRVVIRSGGEG